MMVLEMLCLSIVRYEIFCSFFWIFSDWLIVMLAHVFTSFWVMSHVFWTTAMSPEKPRIGSHSFKVLIAVKSEVILLPQMLCVKSDD